jgi:hypothetical protein
MNFIVSEGVGTMTAFVPTFGPHVPLGQARIGRFYTDAFHRKAPTINHSAQHYRRKKNKRTLIKE